MASDVASGRMAFPGHTATRVKAIMVRILDLDVPPEQIPDEQPLYSSAIRLDSLTLLQLLVAFEAEFGCQIDDEDVMAADLRNVASLLRLVEDKLEGNSEDKPAG